MSSTSNAFAAATTALHDLLEAKLAVWQTEMEDEFVEKIRKESKAFCRGLLKGLPSRKRPARSQASEAEASPVPEKRPAAKALAPRPEAKALAPRPEAKALAPRPAAMSGYDQHWYDMFDRANEYFAKHGHNPSHRSHKQLRNWIDNQRTNYNGEVRRRGGGTAYAASKMSDVRMAAIRGAPFLAATPLKISACDTDRGGDDETDEEVEEVEEVEDDDAKGGASATPSKTSGRIVDV